MDSPSNITISVFGRTDVGLIREHNEDSFLVANVDTGLRSSAPEEVITFELGPKGALFLVCDGMGGAAAGEVASTMAIDSIAGDMESSEASSYQRFARRLRRAMESANEKINVQSRINQSERGMGTTCTAVGLVDRRLIIGQIGDSRCYVMRAGRFVQLTKDQSLAWQLIEAGAMTAEEAKSFEHANIILQALGVQDKVDVVLSQLQLCRGDVVLISSDGLHGPVADDEIKGILEAEPDPKKACDALVGKALEREGPDNISVVVARFDGEGLPQQDQSPTLAFEAFDPGIDPDDPEPPRKSVSLEKATVELPAQPDLTDPTSPGAMPTRMVGASASTPTSSSELRTDPEPRTQASRPFLTFVLITLLAALGGAIFLALQQPELPDLPSHPVHGASGPAPSAAEPAPDQPSPH